MTARTWSSFNAGKSSFRYFRKGEKRKEKEKKKIEFVNLVLLSVFTCWHLHMCWAPLPDKVPELDMCSVEVIEKLNKMYKHTAHVFQSLSLSLSLSIYLSLSLLFSILFSFFLSFFLSLSLSLSLSHLHTHTSLPPLCQFLEQNIRTHTSFVSITSWSLTMFSWRARFRINVSSSIILVAVGDFYFYYFRWECL